MIELTFLSCSSIFDCYSLSSFWSFITSLRNSSYCCNCSFFFLSWSYSSSRTEIWFLYSLRVSFLLLFSCLSFFLWSSSFSLLLSCLMTMFVFYSSSNSFIFRCCSLKSSALRARSSSFFSVLSFSDWYSEFTSLSCCCFRRRRVFRESISSLFLSSSFLSSWIFFWNWCEYPKFGVCFMQDRTELTRFLTLREQCLRPDWELKSMAFSWGFWIWPWDWVLSIVGSLDEVFIVFGICIIKKIYEYGFICKFFLLL